MNEGGAFWEEKENEKNILVLTITMLFLLAKPFFFLYCFVILTSLTMLN